MSKVFHRFRTTDIQYLIKQGCVFWQKIVWTGHCPVHTRECKAVRDRKPFNFPRLNHSCSNLCEFVGKHFGSEACLKEKNIHTYPELTVRELVMNAIMGRDYQ